ncbi:MAG: hypothetical protein HOP13_19395 [Alphaproteobacteria bacterium]|nr:hypothetical protein [Alphaproteobacteria bacterium]
MRRAVLLASIAIAATASPVLFAPVAQAADGREWVDKRIKWQSDVAQLTLRIRDYRLSPRYCKPTHPKDKTFDEVSLNQLEEELVMLGGEFERIKAGTEAATQGSSGGDLTETRLMTGEYPTYRGFKTTQREHWINLKRDNIDEARRLLSEKRAKLAKAPEDACGDTGKKTAEIIGSPPVVPPPPPIATPTFLPVSVSARPPRFCSIDEKFAWLTALSKQREDMIENEKRAYKWAQDIGKRESATRGDTAALRALRAGAIAQREAYLAMQIQAARLFNDVLDNMQVEKCGGDTTKEIGMLPGNNGASVSVAAGVGELTIPRKPYVALENAGNLRLGAAQVKRTETVAALLLGLSYDLDFLPKIDFGKTFGDTLSQRTKVTGELVTYDATVKASGGSITTTTEGVGIPGTGDPGHPSPAGYFLANPAFNDVTDIAYRFESRLDSLHLAIAQEQQYRCWSGTIAVGGRVARLETSDRFSGSIPGFARDFEYETDLETAIWGLFVATEAELSLDGAWDNALRYAGEFSGFRVAAGARFGVDFVSADGTDRLDFTGFAPQSIAVSKDDTTINYRLSVDLKYTPPSVRALTLSLGAAYGQDDIHPVANRSGETGDRTQIEFQDQDLFIGTIRSTFTF